MEVIQEVSIMTTFLTIVFEMALIGVVIAFLPYILGFIAVCFSLACILSLVTGFCKSN